MATVVAPPRAFATTRPVVRKVPRWWRDLSAAAMWVVLLLVTALWVKDGGLQGLTSAAGAMTSLGRLTGLIASALLLVQVFLMARVPFIEQAWGQDELTRLHRLVGFTSFNLMVAHIVLITIGYAGGLGNAWSELVKLVLDYPGMLLATAGTLALCLVVVTSVKAARRTLRYESWHLLHLYAYLGAGLALPHQLWTGQEFLKSPAATAFWWTLYAVSAGAVLVYRLGLPAWRSLRAPLRVVGVERVSRDVVSVTVGGPGVAGIKAHGGQFFQWRFFDGRGWTSANPYSLSAAPTRDTLRFTAALVGDGSARLPLLKRGTRVLVEGPYGRLHAGTAVTRKALLIGAGIGITPMRALLESLPGDVVLINRVSSRKDLVLHDELGQLAARRHATYHVVDGHRDRNRDSWLPAKANHWHDHAALLKLCPDVAQRDVFICGAPAWMDAVERAALDAGVPAAQIHTERFEF